MLASVVRLTVRLTPNQGQLDEFRSIAQAMTEATQAEPGALGYEWFTGANGQFHLLETYVDAGAVLAHFLGPVVQQMVPRLQASARSMGLRCMAIPVRKLERWWPDSARKSSPTGRASIADPGRLYCFSRSMVSYSCRAIPARICAGVQPARVFSQA